jgi:hypothetical protein
VSLSPGKAFAVAVAALAGPAVAVALAAGGGPQLPPVTIGSTTGDPTGNLCVSADCTFLPYSGVTPEMQVPLNGELTSFAVNSGSAGAPITLRVLRPASSGQFTAIASSLTETTAGGPQSFPLSPEIPVSAGDVLALDNSNNALLFDTTTSTDTAWEYNPALAAGATGPPNGQAAGYRLLVSATILPNPTTTTISTTTVTSTTVPPPVLSHVSQTHKTWRLGTKLATISSGKKPPPVGTTFEFGLDQPAQVSFGFVQLFPARKVKGKCVPQTSHNLHASKCTRYGRKRTMSLTAGAGSDKVAFDGRVSRSTKLKHGSYEVSIQASAAGGRSNTVTLRFTIAS